MKLNQVIAIEKGIKTKVEADITTIHRVTGKPSLFEGFNKTYDKKMDDGEDLPSEKKIVQGIASRLLDDVTERWAPLFDVTAQKDYANCNAKANVLGDSDKIILKDVPVTYLLFLEKRLTELYKLIATFPVLDPSEEWTFDAATKQHRTDAVLTTRTKKVQRGLVLHPGTDKHPPQTQLITEDVSVGTYKLVKLSGALEEPHRRALLRRIEALQIAVKKAREEANTVAAPKVEVGAAIFNHIFGAKD
jgi:hypothetical protein